MQYSIAFCNRPEAASDVVFCLIVRVIVLDNAVTFRHHGLNRSREIQPKAARGEIFFAITSEDSYVITSTTVD